MAGSFQITSFSPITEAKSGDLTKTCDGEALNTGTEDYGGVLIMNKDTQETIQAGVSDGLVPSGNSISWESAKDYLMPNKDLNCTCFVGYYVPTEGTIYATDSRDFTIKKTGFIFPTWGYAALGVGAVALALMVTKK